MTLNEKIKYVREKYGLTSEDFAKKIGVSQPFISSVENGRKLPGRKTIDRISREFNIPVEFFFRDDVKTPEELAPTPELGLELAKYVKYFKVMEEAINAQLTPDEIMQLIEVAKKYKK